MELLDEESLEEITTTGSVDAYSTPFAFSDGGKEDKERKKKEREPSRHLRGSSRFGKCSTKGLLLSRREVRHDRHE